MPERRSQPMMQATRVTIASTKPLMADLLNDAH